MPGSAIAPRKALAMALSTFRTVVLAMLLLSPAWVDAQYVSDDPSNATTSLGFTVNTGPRVEFGAANIYCWLTPVHTLGTSTTTALPGTPLCGNFPSNTRDAWYRLDVPATGSYRFRISVIASATTPALSDGGLVAYTTPNVATGPFQMLDCATGGTRPAAAMPVLELNCLAPGTKVYLRVWNEQSPNTTTTRNYHLCVQGQDWNDLATRHPIADTPCDVAGVPTSTLTVGNALVTQYNSFACTESFPWEPSCGGYRDGDVWFRALVPASGSVRLFAASGSNSDRWIARLGLAMYTSGGACSSLSQFKEVACNRMNFATAASAEQNVAEVGCLTPGSFIWIRAYSTVDAQSLGARYGAFRIRIEDALLAPSTSTNDDPCTATPLTFAPCPATPTMGQPFQNNYGACATPGIITPGCGNISSSSSRDVWYSFVAPANGIAEIRVNGDNSSVPAFDPAIALYTAGTGLPCSGPMTLVECDEDHGTGLGAYIVRSGLVPGDTYYIRVWGEGAGGNQFGIFNICIKNPVQTPGYCFYVITMTYDASGTPGSQTMKRIIGTDTVTYTTLGNEPNQVFLIELPANVTVQFRYQDAARVVSGGTWYTFSAGQLGQIPRYIDTAGGPVAGPTLPPNPNHTEVTCQFFEPENEDCLGSRTICGPTAVSDTIFLDAPGSYFGYLPDLTVENRGCLGVEQLGGRWSVFRAQADGQVTFSLVPTTIATDNLDFAIWDAGLQPVDFLPVVTPRVCIPNAPPVRCSRAITTLPTGLRTNVTNVFNEGTAGYGWLSALDVLQDHVYLLYVVNNSIPVPSPPYPQPNGTIQSRRYSLIWNQLLDATGATDNTILDCARIILPVELLHFDAEPNGEDVLLTWATGSEKESDHFVVERSTDGVEFTPIGRVNAMGFSMQRQDYYLLDADPMTGVNYYRLRIVDQDGSFEFSDIRVVVMGSPARMTLFPNPTNDQLYITLDKAMDGPVVVDVFDATGRAVYHRNLNVNDAFQAHISVADLAQGSYMLRLSSGAGNVTSARFMKR